MPVVRLHQLGRQRRLRRCGRTPTQHAVEIQSRMLSAQSALQRVDGGHGPSRRAVIAWAVPARIPASRRANSPPAHCDKAQRRRLDEVLLGLQRGGVRPAWPTGSSDRRGVGLRRPSRPVEHVEMLPVRAQQRSDHASQTRVSSAYVLQQRHESQEIGAGLVQNLQIGVLAGGRRRTTGGRGARLRALELAPTRTERQHRQSAEQRRAARHGKGGRHASTLSIPGVSPCASPGR